MDPAVYARAHGVQSESNNVTVTRVACGEIQYRRAVDTYRRDMKYKVNSIRKEQKRLRCCMRSYRRKLRESRQCETDGQVHSLDNNCNTEKQVAVIISGDANTKPSDISSTAKCAAAKSDHLSGTPDDTRIRLTAASAPMVEKKGLIYDSNMKTLSAQSCGPSFSQHVTESDQPPTGLSTREKQENIEAAQTRSVLIGNVGRTVRKGSGKIGASSRQVHVSVADSELEDDAFVDFSDSSDEEEGEQEKAVPIDVVSFRNGRFVREITPLTLLKRNSAYFKSVSKEDNSEAKEVLGAPAVSVHDTDELVSAEEHIHVPDIGTTVRDLKEEDASAAQYSLPTMKSIPLRSMAIASDQSNSVWKNDKPILEEPTSHQKRKGKVGVSFNDIIKIQISNNTKKLFSLVDRLAMSNGIPVTPVERHSKVRITRNDPRENAAIMRRARAAEAGNVASEVPTHGSVYYAIKYGYLPDIEDFENHLQVSPHTSNEFQETSRAPTSSVPSVSTSAYNPSDSVTLANTMSIASLSQDGSTRNFPFSFTESEDGHHHPTKASDDDIGTELASFLSEQREKQRDRRRSSILEASKFVTAARQRRSTLASYRVAPAVSEHSKREKKLFIRSRKESVPEHVEVSEEHKEPWTSAFSRIKMVHTLADLTHIL